VLRAIARPPAAAFADTSRLYYGSACHCRPESIAISAARVLRSRTAYLLQDAAVSARTASLPSRKPRQAETPRRAIDLPPNITLERTAGSHPLAASAQRER